MIFAWIPCNSSPSVKFGFDCIISELKDSVEAKCFYYYVLHFIWLLYCWILGEPLSIIGPAHTIPISTKNSRLFSLFQSLSTINVQQLLLLHLVNKINHSSALASWRRIIYLMLEQTQIFWNKDVATCLTLYPTSITSNKMIVSSEQLHKELQKWHVRWVWLWTLFCNEQSSNSPHIEHKEYQGYDMTWIRQWITGNLF